MRFLAACFRRGSAPAARQGWLRGALVLGFLWLVGCFWHPYYGFTRFLQIDTWSMAETVPELRQAPIFAHPYGYDGEYYAQLAARPAVADPALARVIDNVSYRARRILLSWVAWALAGGDAVGAVRTYAWLNLGAWLALAFLLGKILADDSWRGTVAWAGVLFSAGALHSVRLALTDLPALFLLALALWQVGNRHPGRASGWLALAGLTRETTLLAAVAWWPRAWRPLTGWWRAAAWTGLAAVPLAAWLWYLTTVWGTPKAGVANFTAPLLAYGVKWRESLRLLGTGPDFYLALTSLLALVGVTVQVVYVVWRREWACAWWRLGAIYAGLLLFLGMAVWQGDPGAYTRVLLPLTLAFNVLAVRRQAALGWLLAGNLAVLSGVLALWHVPQIEREFSAGRHQGAGYVVQLDDAWYAIEGRGEKRPWAWTGNTGVVEFRSAQPTTGSVRVRLALVGLTPRRVEIKQDGQVLWVGEVTAALCQAELPKVKLSEGRFALELVSDAPPVREGTGEGGRQLGFALYGFKVD